MGLLLKRCLLDQSRHFKRVSKIICQLALGFCMYRLCKNQAASLISSLGLGFIGLGAGYS
jgi:hypothetical protein